MLANNICDLEEDEKNERYTLVHYLGKARALKLFITMNVLAFVAIIASVALNIAPWSLVLTFFAAPFVWQQTKRFMQKQIKRETFICAVRILAVGACVQVLSFAIGLIL
jgi:1,4-dihydroxy-2-naphthoate octaprenyltransferase